MKIETRAPAVASPRRSSPKRGRLLLAGVALAAAVVVAHLWPAELRTEALQWARDRGFRCITKDETPREALAAAPANWLSSLSPADVPRLAIDIEFRHLQKLRQKRAAALERGLLVTGPDDFVPASIRHGDRIARVRVRLKGDLTDHLDDGSKWSLRVHTRGDDHVLGMRRFSIQHPKTRAFHGEALVLESLRRVGVLAPRFFFAEVVLNGRNIGLMVVEEHFSRELLEANGRRDGVILRFDESWLWVAEIPHEERLTSPLNHFRNAPIEAFRSKRIARSERLSREHSVAVGLLRGFVNGNLSASQVFDADLTGSILAVAELWGAYHVVNWRNIRFYLNPITVQLEPVGYDANLSVRYPPGAMIGSYWQLAATLLRDPEIFSVYQRTLRELADEVEGGSLGEELRSLERRHLGLLHREFPFVREFPPDELSRRARFARAVAGLEPRRYARKLLSVPRTGSRIGQGWERWIEHYPTLLHAYLVQDADLPYLEVANAVPLPVEIRSIDWVADGDTNGSLPFRPVGKVALPLRLPPTPHGTLPHVRRIAYHPPRHAARALLLSANVPGRARRYAIEARPYFAPRMTHPIPTSSVKEQLERHPFLEADADTRTLGVVPGSWPVRVPLVVPRGYRLRIAAGTTLRFAAEAGLISHGPLLFEGAADAPIVLRGAGAEGQQATWQGVAVLRAGAPSRWAHVTVRDTIGIRRPGWELTGGVTFYRSDVAMERCVFRGNRGEDALNIVHSRFQMEDTRIVDAVSDGLDVDFSQGIIAEGLFEHLGRRGGGDGVDASGSSIEVRGTRFREIADKAISVGENSQVSASRLTIEGAGTGAASKDGSHLDISDSVARGIRHAVLMAYVKKAEFGPGRIDARDLSLDGRAPAARAQKGSVITVDGNPVADEDLDVDALYRTIMKPGRSP